MKKILVVTTFNNHFRFFHRLSTTLNQLNYKTDFLTNKNSILQEASNLNLSIFQLKHVENEKSSFDVANSFEVATDSLTKKKAERIAGAVTKQLENIFSKGSYEYVFLWGGVRLIEMSVLDCCRAYGIRTIFFELGNFPNKVFVDPRGTNARSLLANNENVLSSFNGDLKSFREWNNNYLKESLNKHAVPQVASAVGIEYSKNALDIIGYRVKNLIQTEPIITKEKLIGKYLRKFIKLSYDKVDVKKSQYLFFPMQVNKDAQLILNSDVGNLEALKIASRTAKDNGLKLFVKPHPGEVEFGFIKKVNELKEELGFSFVNDNTIELIVNADEVITINSTVGLQAKLFGKTVSCLGKAFYSNFNEEMLASYIQHYLVDADFWNDLSIPVETAQKILARADLK